MMSTMGGDLLMVGLPQLKKKLIIESNNITLIEFIAFTIYNINPEIYSTRKFHQEHVWDSWTALPCVPNLRQCYPDIQKCTNLNILNEDVIEALFLPV